MFTKELNLSRRHPNACSTWQIEICAWIDQMFPHVYCKALEMKRLSRTKKLERRHCKVTARIRHKRLLNILIYDITYSLNSELDKYICHFDYMVLIHVFTLRSFCFSFAFQTPSNPGYICLNLESSCFLCRNLGMLSLGVPRNLIVKLFSLWADSNKISLSISSIIFIFFDPWVALKYVGC